MTPQECLARFQQSIAAIADPDLTFAATSVVDDYIGQIEESFAGAVDPDGNPWAPIFYRDVPPDPLVLSGALKDSVVADAATADVNRRGFETSGNLVEYAIEQDQGREPGVRTDNVSWVHRRYGVKIYKKYITWHPGRPFLGLGDKVMDQAVVHGQDELVNQALAAW